jgi:hypothetical protein
MVCRVCRVCRVEAPVVLQVRDCVFEGVRAHHLIVRAHVSIYIAATELDTQSRTTATELQQSCNRAATELDACSKASVLTSS